MTAMTSAAGASTVMDCVDWSAMARRLTVHPVVASRSPGRLLLTGSPDWLDWAKTQVPQPWATMPAAGPGRRGPGVREFSIPATTEVGPGEAITDLLAENVAEYGDQVGLRVQRD